MLSVASDTITRENSSVSEAASVVAPARLVGVMSITCLINGASTLEVKPDNLVFSFGELNKPAHIDEEGK